MTFPIFTLTENQNLNIFIDFWYKLYKSSDREKLYLDAIHKEQFEAIDIDNLYNWKNGSIFSAAKQNSYDTKIKLKLNKINSFKRDCNFSTDLFLKEFSDVSAVWKIFLLHIIKPKNYPIYDQNIHRAYSFIHGLDFMNITSTMSDEEKNKFYFDKYLKFVENLELQDYKKFDEAFFSLGGFIKRFPMFFSR